MNQFMFLAFVDLVVNCAGFLFAYSLQTEKFYDLTGK